MNIIDIKEKSIWYILAILNSKLMAFFHYENSPKSKKRNFPKVLVNDLRGLPIANDDKTMKLIDKIISDNYSLGISGNFDAGVNPLPTENLHKLSEMVEKAYADISVRIGNECFDDIGLIVFSRAHGVLVHLMFDCAYILYEATVSKEGVSLKS